MVRPLGIEFPGAVYHVTSRGNACSDIYIEELDRQTFLNTFAYVCQKFNWR